MDFNLKQWRDEQQESEEEEQNPAKIPRQLFLETPHPQPQQTAALPLFVSSESEPQPNKITTLFSQSSYSSSTPPPIPKFPRVGGGGGQCFSLSQWQELELQAVIFKHIMAGAVVPQELLQLLKRSLLSSPAVSPFYNLHHFPPHFQPPPALVQAGYWGKGAMDPEPGRCRRTDGKKWRCSRDVVAGHKYCERHMHRGRNRSRKPVEFPASTGAGGGSFAPAFPGGSADTATVPSPGPQFSLSGSGPSLDTFQLNHGSSELSSSDKKSGNKVLMHFFDDWPRSLQGSNNGENNGNSSSSSLTMSNAGNNSTSDFLRLSTGNGIELRERGGNEERHRGQFGWTTSWGASRVGSMAMGGGGPLAEALRSSTHSSPTSVLHQLARGTASDTTYVTA